MICLLVDLDKALIVFPVGIGYIIHRLLANFFLLVTDATTTEACININLCSGLGAGIEGAVHATLSEYIKA